MQKNPVRPERKYARDFAGRSRALPDDALAWTELAKPAQPEALLLLGCVPGGEAPLPFVAEAQKLDRPIYYLESPALADIFAPAPAGWRKMDAGCAPDLAPNALIMLYRPALAIEPDFWLPLLARLEAAAAGYARTAKASPRAAWLPGSPSDLLHQELAVALARAGYSKIFTRQSVTPDLDALLACWEGQTPDLAISVNFRGLDPEGKVFSLCRELGVPLAIWLVDNPWNLLSGITLPWWKKASLFVTDASFLPLLQQYGCRNVRFCPLAASWHMLAEPEKQPDAPALFVGRAGFAGQRSFFSGVKLPPALLAEAEALSPAMPDWHWWNEKIAARLWPGLAMRQISCGADLFSGRNRASWLKPNLDFLRIVGDESWQSLLPGAAVLPPVDYYGKLPGLYRQSLATLNITSLLLPQSLSQRHFDVWAAGGFLLSDATPGLAIFPDELTGPIRLAAPAELPERLAWLKDNPARALELRHAWREEIFARHLYGNRLEYLAGSIGVKI